MKNRQFPPALLFDIKQVQRIFRRVRSRDRDALNRAEHDGKPAAIRRGAAPLPVEQRVGIEIEGDICWDSSQLVLLVRTAIERPYGVALWIEEGERAA